MSYMSPSSNAICISMNEEVEEENLVSRKQASESGRDCTPPNSTESCDSKHFEGKTWKAQKDNTTPLKVIDTQSSSCNPSSMDSNAQQKDGLIPISILTKIFKPEFVSELKSLVEKSNSTSEDKSQGNAVENLIRPTQQIESLRKNEYQRIEDEELIAALETRLKVKRSSFDLDKNESVEAFYLKCVSRGMTRRVSMLFAMLNIHRTITFDKNSVDTNKKSAMVLAIENRDTPMMELLLDNGVEARESIFHCIEANFLDGAILLLKRDSCIDIEIKGENSFFHTGMTPMILAGQANNYDMLYLLHQFGHQMLESEGKYESGCETWDTANKRRMICQARASPAYITLVNTENNMNPVSYCLKEHKTLSNYNYLEHDSSFYEDLQKQLEQYMCSLLDQICSSVELAHLFQYDYEPVRCSSWKSFYDDALGRRDLKNCFELLELASEQRLIQFVTHPQSQLAVSYIRYRSLPFLRGRKWPRKIILAILIGIMFPLLSLFYLVAPNSRLGGIIQLPTILHISHLMSDILFSIILLLNVLGQSLDDEAMRVACLVLESLIFAWILGKWVQEIEEYHERGFKVYFSEIWNFIDLVMLVLFSISAIIRLVDVIINAPENPSPRSEWNAFEPRLIAEGFQAWGYVFVFLRLLGLMRFSRNLGPLQVSLGRMVTDVIRFLCIFVLLLSAFAIGLSELYWYYDTKEGVRILCNSSIPANDTVTGNTCSRTHRESTVRTLFYFYHNLFWALFGQMNFADMSLAGKHQFTEAVGWSLVAVYHFVAIIVLLNMLIAMMNNSYTETSEKEETVWKFQRTLIWIRFFRKEVVRPPPMNLLPNVWRFIENFQKKDEKKNSNLDKTDKKLKFWCELDYPAKDQMKNADEKSVASMHGTPRKPVLNHVNETYSVISTDLESGSRSYHLGRKRDLESKRFSISPEQYYARSRHVLDILVRRYKMKYLTTRKHEM